MIAVTDLRKIFSAQGIKGFGSANRATFSAAIEAAEVAAYAEDAARTPVVPVEVTPVETAKKGFCTSCGIRRGMNAATRRSQGAGRSYSDMCLPCYELAGWENAHSDHDHEGITEIAEADRTAEQAAEIAGCWVCFPQLDETKKAPRTGRSRIGMEIVAKGSEIHKSATFKAAAEAAGWTVEISTQEYGDDDETNTRHFADAQKDGNSIQLAWDGRKYDYAASSASFGGNSRKIRNLKEALRLL